MSEAGRLRLGIVGTGAVAQLVHLPLCSSRRDVELVAVADKERDKAEALADRFGVKSILETGELLAHPKLDAVIICTPNHLHEEEAVSALEAGKHVLVERPLALSPEGCARVVDAARTADRTLVVGMNHRFRPDVSALRSFVASGELGRVYGGRVAWMNRHVPLRRTTWRQRPEAAGGGALMDLGVQALDLLFWILGGVRVQRVSALLKRETGELEDAATLLMATEEGVALSLEVSWSYFASEDTHYARVLGTQGSGQLPPLEIYRQLGGRPMEVTPRQGSDSRGGNRFMKAHRRQLDHFFRSARGFSRADLPTGQEHLMSVIRAAYASAEEGREVSL